MNVSSTERRLALLVIDQLPYHVLDARRASHPKVTVLGKLELGYVPRTTPVGHATLSTGWMPSIHGVQGREWYEEIGSEWKRHRLDDLPRGTFDPNLVAWLKANGLATKIREQQPNSRIVVVAAKAMIPFLFGGWNADICVYPTDVAPRQDTTGRYKLAVRVEAFTREGAEVLRATHEGVLLETERLMDSLVKGCDFEWEPLPSESNLTLLEMHIVLPAAWGTNYHCIAELWHDITLEHCVEIDVFYRDIGISLLDSLPPTNARVFVQSCFSTDYRGHEYGVDSGEYGAALDELLRSAVAIADDEGFLVIGTSDHGGRPTPVHLLCDLTEVPPLVTDNAGNPVKLREARYIVHSGDHLVGYGGSSGVAFLQWTGGQEIDVGTYSSVVDRSFAASQRPSWLLLPNVNERYSRTNSRLRPHPSGGDHGACAEGRKLSEIDNSVPLFGIGSAQYSSIPSSLEGVAGWLLTLL